MKLAPRLTVGAGEPRVMLQRAGEPEAYFLRGEEIGATITALMAAEALIEKIDAQPFRPEHFDLPTDRREEIVA